MASNRFNSIRLQQPKRSLFDLSHDVKFTGNMGNLYPIMVQECLPSDIYNIGCDSLIRFSPLISPVMHRMNAFVHYFFVPNRLLWSGWEDFITGKLALEHPYVQPASSWISDYPLLDYMGIPELASGNTVKFNSLPLAAYQMIYNEYYRDQNLIAEVDYTVHSGNNNGKFASLLPLRKRAWQHDYFSGSLPFAQAGAAVDIPLGNVTGQVVYKDSNSNPNPTTVGVTTDLATANVTRRPGESLFATLGIEGTTEATSINDLRTAWSLQRWLELAARVGRRYKESIKGFFGVDAGDARLDRPEYITGTRTPIVISEVLNTTGIDGELPQGNMAGHSATFASGGGSSYACKEHGWIIGIMSVLPIPAYQDGVHKQWFKTDRLDYAFPQFAHLGEQEITNKEIFTRGSNPDDVFGYVPRYSEYTFNWSRVAGDFKSSLSHWVLSRKFANQPFLNESFIEMNGDDESMRRIFAVTDPNEDTLYIQVLNKVSAIRPLPKYGTPI